MNFKNLKNLKNYDIFKKCIKIYFSQNFKCLVFFKPTRPVYYQLNLNLI